MAVEKIIQEIPIAELMKTDPLLAAVVSQGDYYHQTSRTRTMEDGSVEIIATTTSVVDGVLRVVESRSFVPATDEVLLEEPVLEASATAAEPVASPLLELKVSYDTKVLQSVNDASPLFAEKDLPTLPEVVVTGYVRGQAQQTTCCQIGPHLAEKFTAYDFILMQAAAAQDGIKLSLSSAFRTMEKQQQLWEERQDPVVKKKKGVAAKPGFSNHQSGVALDIHVGMSRADRLANQFTSTFLWLTANAALFGFDNEEVPDEPWHWRHREKRIVGLGVTSGQLQSVIDLSVLQFAALDDGRMGLKIFVDRDHYDRARAPVRSQEMARSQRDLLFAASGAEAVGAAAYLNNLIALYNQAERKAEPPLPEFNQKTLSPLTYDFTKGEWGDEEPV